MANWLKVQSVIAPFMGYLGAKQAGNTQLAQQQLTQYTQALNSLRQLLDTKLDIAKLPSDIAYKEAMGKQAVGYGQRATAEANQINAEMLKADELSKFLQESGLTTEEQSKAIIEAYKAKQAKDTYLAEQQAGTTQAGAYQKAQESLYAGKTAEANLSQNIPISTAQAKSAENQGIINTAVPTAENKLRELRAKASQEEVNADMQRKLNESLIYSRENMGKLGENVKTIQAYSNILNQTTDNLGAVNNMIRGLTSGSKNNNQAFELLQAMGANVPQIGTDDNPKDKQALLDILMQQRNTLMRQQITQANVASESTGLSPEFFGASKSTQLEKPSIYSITQQTWNSIPESQRQALREKYGNNLRIINSQTKNSSKKQTQTSTGNYDKQKSEATKEISNIIKRK